MNPNTLIEEMMRTWADPHARHALLGHVPLVFGILGILPLLLLAATGFRSAALKVGIVLWFGIAAGGAYLAREAGEDAEHALEKREPALSQVEHAALERHEDLGKLAWIWPLIPAGTGLFMLARSRRVQVLAGVATVLATVGVAGATGLVGHTGGRLVYLYGVGVPERGAAPQGAEATMAPPTQPPAAQPEAPPEDRRSLVPPRDETPKPAEQPAPAPQEPPPAEPPAEDPPPAEPPAEDPPPAEPTEPPPSSPENPPRAG